MEKLAEALLAKEVLFQSDVELLIGKRPYEEKKVLDVPVDETPVAEVKPAEKPAGNISPAPSSESGPGLFPLPA